MKKAIYSLLISLFIISCEITKPSEEKTIFKGITETREDGSFRGRIDSTDWLPDGCGTDGNCMLDGLASYPNPCVYETSLEFTISKDGFVKIVLNDKPGSELLVLVNNNLKAGTYVYRLDVIKNNLKPGIYRFYIEFEPTGGKIYKSFGDIQIKV